MKVKTSEMEGMVLDWAVRTCQGWRNLHWHTYRGAEPQQKVLAMWHNRDWNELANMPVEWDDAGPIIERERLCVLDQGGCFSAHYSRGKTVAQRWNGPTILIAAMRCYVASKMGEEVEVPDELMQ